MYVIGGMACSTVSGASPICCPQARKASAGAKAFSAPLASTDLLPLVKRGGQDTPNSRIARSKLARCPALLAGLGPERPSEAKARQRSDQARKSMCSPFALFFRVRLGCSARAEWAPESEGQRQQRKTQIFTAQVRDIAQCHTSHSH